MCNEVQFTGAGQDGLWPSLKMSEAQVAQDWLIYAQPSSKMAYGGPRPLAPGWGAFFGSVQQPVPQPWLMGRALGCSHCSK